MSDLEFVETRAFGGPELRVFRHVASGALLHELPGDGAGLPPFLIGRSPLRQEEWDRLGGGGDRRPLRDPDLPISGVSFLEARRWLARAGLRLPSEAEWEYACRAGTTSAFWWGDVFDPARAWFLDNGEGRPHPVHEHADQFNGFGLVDMAGNVSEWCEADLDVPMQGSDWQEGNPGRVHRGGSFDHPSGYCQSGRRAGSDPRASYPDLGLRVACDLPPD